MRRLVILPLLAIAACDAPLEPPAPDRLAPDALTLALSAAEAGYTINDLGRMGGDWARPTLVNELGQMVGRRRLDGALGWYFWDAATGVTGIDIPHGASMSGSMAGLNRQGQAAVTLWLNTGHRHAALWDPASGFLDLGTLGGGNSIARAINETGQVAGEAQLPGGIWRAFRWDPHSGDMVDLGEDTYASRAWDINDAGQVSGVVFGDGERWATRWDMDGTVTTISPPGFLNSAALYVNGAGQVAGPAWTGSNRAAFFWDPVAGVTLITQPEGWSQPTALNDAGQVVGYYQEVSSGVFHAFVWDAASGFQDLGNLGRRTVAVDINDAGQVADNFLTLEGEWHAWVWDPTDGTIDLGTLGWGNSRAVRILEDGTVVGSNYGRNPATGVYDETVVTWTRSRTPEQWIALLADKVAGLVEDNLLRAGEAEALSAKLDAAAAQLARGNETAAANVLGAFITQVEALVRSRRLAAQEGAALIRPAEAAIAALEA